MAAASRSPIDKPPRRTRLRVIAGLLIIGLGLGILMERHFANLDYLVVTSESMEPTLRIGDRVLMERANAYHAGDIVIFTDPEDPTRLVVKRILAMPGSQVLALNDELTVSPTPTATPANGRVWRIAPGEVFVAGDNRTVSRDSRDFGPIAIEAIRGTVHYRILSHLRWEKVQ